MEELRFLGKLVKDGDGKLVYKDGDMTRELTEEEKMKATKILIKVVLILM